MEVGGKQPEGVVFLPGGRDVYIASEPDELLHYRCDVKHEEESVRDGVICVCVCVCVCATCMCVCVCLCVCVSVCVRANRMSFCIIIVM